MPKKQRNGLKLMLNTLSVVIGLVLAWRMLPHEKPSDKLIWAIHRQEVTTVKEMLAGGIDLNKDARLQSMLLYSAACSRPDAERATEMVDLLLKAGARCSDAVDVHHALDSGNDKAAILLIDRGGWPASPNLLISASQSCSVPIMQHVIDKTGADVNGLYFYEPPLSWVASAAHPIQESAQLTAAAYLLAHGADPNKGWQYKAKPEEKIVRDRNGTTPLMIAAQKSRVALMKLLLQHGANVNARTYGGQTALLMAVAAQSRSSVEALIAAGASVNCKDNTGQTPLSLARLRDKQKKQPSGIATLLLQAGAKE